MVTWNRRNSAVCRLGFLKSRSSLPAGKQAMIASGSISPPMKKTRPRRAMACRELAACRRTSSSLLHNCRSISMKDIIQSKYSLSCRTARTAPDLEKHRFQKFGWRENGFLLTSCNGPHDHIGKALQHFVILYRGIRGDLAPIKENSPAKPVACLTTCRIGCLSVMMKSFERKEEQDCCADDKDGQHRAPRQKTRRAVLLQLPR